MKQAAVFLERNVKPKIHEEQGMKKAAAETRSVGFDISTGGGLRRRLMPTSPEEPAQHLPGGGDRKVQSPETSWVPVMRAQDSPHGAGTVMQLRLLPRSLLNPFHCSAVKSTSSPVDHSPPSAAFITKFMMRQFCVLFLRWSRFQGRTCSLGHRERKT